MNNQLYLTASAAIAGLLSFSGATAMAQTSSKAFEIGLGGAVINLTRTTVSDFHQTKGGDYVFTLEEKLLYGGTELYLSRELNEWLYADIQGTMGLARYYRGGSSDRGKSIMLGPGIQARPFVRSEWLQPYARIGINYYNKDFPTRYFGQFEGDVTGEALWKAEDAWNKGYTFDSDKFFPLSAGVGLIGWISNSFGMRIQGQFLKSFGGRGANFFQASAGILFRVGGKDKIKSVADKYVSSNPSVYDGFFANRLPERVKEVVKEVVREVPVEVVREVVKEADFSKTLAELMDNVCFDFDKATITPDSESTLDRIAMILGRFPETRFLVAGHADAKGSEAYNYRLSFQRARAVYDELLKRGVPETQIAFRGFGKRVAVIPDSIPDEQRIGDRKVVLERITSDVMWEHLNK